MSKEYFEMREADYTLRIANLDQMRKRAAARGQILLAKSCAKQITDLEHRLELLRQERSAAEVSDD
ncbi:MAG: hypothetical protein IJ120_02645 [Solobacterium sp.]|nr:hypothetical protein [Solobacterium sp.]